MIHFREQCNRLTECSHGLIGVVTTNSSSALYKAKSCARLCVCFSARTTCTHRAPTHLIFSHFLRLGVPDRSRAGQFRHNAQPPSQPLTVSISSIHWKCSNSPFCFLFKLLDLFFPNFLQVLVAREPSVQ